LANLAEAPDEGAVNVTTVPLTAWPSESVTRATTGDPNAVPATVNWGVPVRALIVAAERLLEIVQQNVVVGLIECVRSTANT
jgi:hypothetical protein